MERQFNRPLKTFSHRPNETLNEKMKTFSSAPSLVRDQSTPKTKRYTPRTPPVVKSQWKFTVAPQTVSDPANEAQYEVIMSANETTSQLNGRTKPKVPPPVSEPTVRNNHNEPQYDTITRNGSIPNQRETPDSTNGTKEPSWRQLNQSHATPTDFKQMNGRTAPKGPTPAKEPKPNEVQQTKPLPNYYKYKIKSAIYHRRQPDPAYLHLLGIINVLSHKLAYVEEKLNCRDEMQTTINFEEIGESSTDEIVSSLNETVAESPIKTNVRAAQTTALTMDLPFSNGSVRSLNSVESRSSGGSSDSVGEYFSIRVRIPEIDTQSYLSFRRDRPIWNSKMQLLKTVGSALTDGLNYGFYLPPSHGKAGKFLEEERLFSDYPTDPANMPFLEFKYKRRVYKQMKLDIKEVKKYHNKSNVKMFFEAVRTKNIEKIVKMTGKCMDPNIHEESTGESPLTIAATLKNCGDVIQVLVSGGAHLDFRSRDGKTALHKAVEKGNQSVTELLLGLGASPNSKDLRGMTALYYNVQKGGDPMIAEVLLKDRTDLNISDDQGWKEIHHACRHGRIQHLQLLIYYGADIDSQNEAGNTPLHVCAIYKEESAARMLLFRGADRSLKNKSSQTAFQVAIVANNFPIGEVIRNYSDENVVRQQELPSYNNRRKTSMAGNLNRATSEPFLAGNSVGCIAGTRMSIASSSSSGFPEEENLSEVDSPTTPIRTGSVGSIGQVGTTARMVHRKIQDAKQGKLYVAVKDYSAQEYGELTLRKGDYVKVMSIGEFNFWEGEVGHIKGWFPSYCVHEVTGKEKAQTMRERKANYPESMSAKKEKEEPEPRVVFVERKKKGFGFILRGAKSPQGATSAFKPSKGFPALQYLEHVDKGSPAEKANLKRGDFVLEINGQDVTASPHQYVVSLVVNSPDTIVMKVITLPDSKALVWLNEAKKGSLRKKPPPAQPSLTKAKGERAQQELMALSELDEAIAVAEKTPEDQTEATFASIRKRPVSQKFSPEHLSQVFKRQGSDPTSATNDQQPEARSSLKKPSIPLAPSAYRFNTIARMSSSKHAAIAIAPTETIAMETQTQFDDDDQQIRRNSASSDSAVSSLRSSPASSYSYTTTVSNDSGVHTKVTPTDSVSPMEPIMSQVPPAPNYPAPIPPAPSYPAPTNPKLQSRSQSLYDLYTDKPLTASPESPLGPRRMSMGQKRPNKPPPPIPKRESSISEGNLAQMSTSEKPRPASLAVSSYAEIPASPSPESSGSEFANAIAAAAAKRERLRRANSVDSLDSIEPKTPLQLALAARDQSLQGGNQNRNQNAETTVSQGSPQMALNEAIARRKAHLDSNKDPNESIENKIRKYRQSDSAKGSSANQALLTAIAKRRSTIEKQIADDSDSQSTSSEGSCKTADTTPSKDAPTAPGIKETDIAQAAATMKARLASKPPAKEPATSFGGHKNVIKIVPRGEVHKSTSPASHSPRENTDSGPEMGPSHLTPKLDKIPKPDHHKHPLSPVKENAGEDTSLPPPPAAFLNFNAHQSNGLADPDSPLGDHDQSLHRRERSFDTASVVSSMSSMSTMSSFSTMSTEPSSDIFEQDEDDARTSTMKSTSSSVSSNSTVTSKSSKPSPKVLPKPKKKSHHMDEETTPSSGHHEEVLDNAGSLVINTVPTTDVDNKHSMTSAWTQQGSNGNSNNTEEWRTKPFLSWTPQDVGLWLIGLNMSEHRSSFEENEITGEHLSSLSKDDLQELGVGRLGHRLTIMKAIQQQLPV
ncbi:uncharacterized protein [Asterias amurensis]|uniref:uncharacterized protein isoform X1 n=2 Tax=Asterias amurensis TaxID=7602 RepID=UPI003AB26BF4